MVVQSNDVCYQVVDINVCAIEKLCFTIDGIILSVDDLTMLLYTF